MSFNVAGLIEIQSGFEEVKVAASTSLLQRAGRSQASALQLLNIHTPCGKSLGCPRPSKEHISSGENICTLAYHAIRGLCNPVEMFLMGQREQRDSCDN